MIFRIVNESGMDVFLHINQKSFLIKAGDCDTVVQNEEKTGQISVHKATNSTLPNRKKMIWSEVLGGAAALFFKPECYIFDVSQTAQFVCYADIVTLRIARIKKESEAEGIYDILSICTSDINIEQVKYCVENINEITDIYKRSRAAAHMWLYVLLELIFVIMGMIVTYPVLFVIYLATSNLFIKIVMLLIPVLLIAVVGVCCILPLHLFFAYQDKKFYQAMNHAKIWDCIKQ